MTDDMIQVFGRIVQSICGGIRPCSGAFLFSIVSGTIGRSANGLLVFSFSWMIMV